MEAKLRVQGEDRHDAVHVVVLCPVDRAASCERGRYEGKQEKMSQRSTYGEKL